MDAVDAASVVLVAQTLEPRFGFPSQSFPLEPEGKQVVAPAMGERMGA